VCLRVSLETVCFSVVSLGVSQIQSGAWVFLRVSMGAGWFRESSGCCRKTKTGPPPCRHRNNDNLVLVPEIQNHICPGFQISFGTDDKVTWTFAPSAPAHRFAMASRDINKFTFVASHPKPRVAHSSTELAPISIIQPVGSCTGICQVFWPTIGSNLTGEILQALDNKLHQSMQFITHSTFRTRKMPTRPTTNTFTSLFPL